MMEQRDVTDGDVSETENEAPDAEEQVVITPELRFLNTVLKSSSKPRPEITVYKGDLNPEELIDWINDMEKFFDYEEMEDEKKVKFAVTKLKGHAALWWDGVQVERRRLGK